MCFGHLFYAERTESRDHTIGLSSCSPNSFMKALLLNRVSLSLHRINLIMILSVWRTSGSSGVLLKNCKFDHSQSQSWTFRLWKKMLSVFYLPRFIKDITEHFSMQQSKLFLWLYFWKHFAMLNSSSILAFWKTESSNLQKDLLSAYLEWLIFVFSWEWEGLGLWTNGIYLCSFWFLPLFLNPLNLRAILGGNYCLSKP